MSRDRFLNDFLCSGIGGAFTSEELVDAFNGDAAASVEVNCVEPLGLDEPIDGVSTKRKHPSRPGDRDKPRFGFGVLLFLHSSE